MQVKGVDGKWQPVHIPSSVKAIVLLNLQSYGGGRDIWGLADTNKDTQRGWKTPIFNDGMFEVGGLICNLLFSVSQLHLDLACVWDSWCRCGQQGDGGQQGYVQLCIRVSAALHPTSANDLP